MSTTSSPSSNPSALSALNNAALKLKTKGNTAFQQEAFSDAIELYSEGLALYGTSAAGELLPGWAQLPTVLGDTESNEAPMATPARATSVASSWGSTSSATASPERVAMQLQLLLASNRAQCWLNLQKPMRAVGDAIRCVEFDPTHDKSRLRLARGLMDSNQLDKAETVCEGWLLRHFCDANGSIGEQFNSLLTQIKDARVDGAEDGPPSASEVPSSVVTNASSANKQQQQNELRVVDSICGGHPLAIELVDSGLDMDHDGLRDHVEDHRGESPCGQCAVCLLHQQTPTEQGNITNANTTRSLLTDGDMTTLQRFFFESPAIVTSDIDDNGHDTMSTTSLSPDHPFFTNLLTRIVSTATSSASQKAWGHSTWRVLLNTEFLMTALNIKFRGSGVDYAVSSDWDLEFEVV